MAEKNKMSLQVTVMCREGIIEITVCSSKTCNSWILNTSKTKSIVLQML